MEVTRKIISNFGFLLQITGLLLVLPIAIGLHNGEIQPVASLVATCFLSFGIGFFLNSFCERKELDEKTSLWLMIINFTALPLVLTIPYIWNNVFASGNPFDLLTNAYFETVSGFTTTGFTFISNPEYLPLSLFFYRSLIEFVGGIGFVYILVAFLHPNYTLDTYAKTFGVDKLGDNLKKMFLSIILIYTFFVVLFTAVFYLLYSQNMVVASATAIDILTGGYQPKIAPGIGLFQISALILMLVGSINFKFHFNLFHFRLRIALTREVKLYLGIIAGTTILAAFVAWVNPLDSLFQVVSIISSTGIDYINVAALPVAAKTLFISIGLIGGCAFSLAGGIRIQRIQLLIDALRKKGNQPSREQLMAVLSSIIGFLAVLLVLSLLFSTIGISLLDSVFEVGSALTTNGISLGLTTVTLPQGYKWLLILAMLIGRIEIVAILRALYGANILKVMQRLVSSIARRKLRRASYAVSSQ